MRLRAVALALLMSCCASSGYRFESRLPPEVPDISGWEKAWGIAELLTPPRSVDYELYVSPARPSVYSVARYRVRRQGTSPDAEKLQWDRDGRDVRRYECLGDAGAQGAPCRWRELARGTSEYNDEFRSLVAVYFMHAEKLNGPQAAGLR